MVSTVPERVTVWVGSVRVCAQLDSERANTTRRHPVFRLLASCISPYVAESIYSALAKFPRQPHAKPSVFRRLCRNWKIYEVAKQVAGVRWRVVDGVSPNIARYLP